MNTRARRTLRTLLVLGLVAACVGAGSFAAFTSATSSSANTVAAGTVVIGDNDAGASVLALPAAAPGASATGCIAVTYTGTLDAGVRLSATLTGTLGPHLALTVTRGTQATPAFNSCAGFVPDAADHIGAGAGVIFSGPLSSFPASYATGIVDPRPAAPATWTTGDRRVYRFAVTLGGSPAGQGLAQTAAFTWEARNL
jgi:predicted ribosomally synthesized peptide with SipW-like signal peptide